MFIATLKNGDQLCFGRKCNKIDYSCERMVLFKNEKESQSIILAVIPTDNILTIINEIEEDVE